MSRSEWICPCPECNGLGPNRWDQFEDDEYPTEPEHPENTESAYPSWDDWQWYARQG